MVINMKMVVNTIPPYKINLSWVVRLSINLITVLLSPKVFIRSRTFLCADFNTPRCSRRFSRMPCPDPNKSSIARFEFCKLVLCCKAWSIIIEVSALFGLKDVFNSCSRSLSSCSRWCLSNVTKQLLYTKTTDKLDVCFTFWFSLNNPLWSKKIISQSPKRLFSP